MPYNTRRKSLSLPSLGIHVPVSNAARAAAAALAHRQRSPTALSTPSAHSASSAASSSSSSSSSSSPTYSPRSPAERADNHATPSTTARKLKRPHAHVDPQPAHRQASARKRRQTVSNTPPPSPGFDRAVSIERDHPGYDFHAADHDIDLTQINDIIVEKVILRLQASNNRPHIVKELSGILLTQLPIVQTSANPCAIISSRLSTFIKRPSWSAKKPCPVGKELEAVHPRRTYYYLTTSPHQPLPDPNAQAALTARELPTPSATEGSDAEDDDRRRELSPSPELELEPYRPHDNYDEEEPMPATPLGSFPSRHSISTQTSRTAEPPLETDEKEFTQTAHGLQRRKLSGLMPQASSLPAETPAEPTAGVVVDEHVKDDTLFGHAKALAASTNPQYVPGTPATLMSSPHIHPTARPSMPPFALDLNKTIDSSKARSDTDTFYSQCQSQLGWDLSPEQVDLDELDSLLNGFYQ